MLLRKQVYSSSYEISLYFFKGLGFFCIAQAGPELLKSSNLPASASKVSRSIVMCLYAWFSFFFSYKVGFEVLPDEQLCLYVNTNSSDSKSLITQRKMYLSVVVGIESKTCVCYASTLHLPISTIIRNSIFEILSI